MSRPTRQPPASLAKWLKYLYAAFAVFSVVIAVDAALHGHYGSALLNAVLTALWVGLFIRLRARYPS